MRAILVQEGEWWCGQCIEKDIAAQSKSFEGVKKELVDMVDSYKELGKWEGVAEPPATPQDIVDELRRRPGAQEVDIGE